MNSPTPAIPGYTLLKCPECERVFDLRDDTDSDEWAYGHDCEAPS